MRTAVSIQPAARTPLRNVCLPFYTLLLTLFAWGFLMTGQARATSFIDTATQVTLPYTTTPDLSNEGITVMSDFLTDYQSFEFTLEKASKVTLKLRTDSDIVNSGRPDNHKLHVGIWDPAETKFQYVQTVNSNGAVFDYGHDQYICTSTYYLEKGKYYLVVAQIHPGDGQDIEDDRDGDDDLDDPADIKSLTITADAVNVPKLVEDCIPRINPFTKVKHRSKWYRHKLTYNKLYVKLYVRPGSVPSSAKLEVQYRKLNKKKPVTGWKSPYNATKTRTPVIENLLYNYPTVSYEFRVRAVITIEGKTYRSKWSNRSNPGKEYTRLPWPTP